MSDSRLNALQHWLEQQINPAVSIKPVSGDASFRRYFRVDASDRSYIAMDAPPDTENSQAFIDINQLLASNDIYVPKIRAHDLAQGFILLEDFGDEQLQVALSKNKSTAYYEGALTTLLQMQKRIDGSPLPLYSRALLQEENFLFKNWFLNKHLGIQLNRFEHHVFRLINNTLIKNALEQPKVFVHRDFHSRNLMLVDGKLGVLDFQDAVYGPITYDLVSLLKDCYIAWPQQQVTDWTRGYFQQAQSEQIIKDVDEATFMRWFDLMGVQRHLKALGIFARLHHRDGKSNFLKEMPRVLEYVLHTSGRYEALSPLLTFLTQRNIKDTLKALCKL